MAEKIYVEVPCRLLSYEERTSSKNQKTYADITVRVNDRVVKLTVEPNQAWNDNVDTDVVVLCEVAVVYGTLTNTLKGVSIKG